MKVIVDSKIPYIDGPIEALVDEVVYAPGNAFTPELIKDADALIIRTRTKCNRELLEGSKVQFIATATVGYDHIDVSYCREAGISWINTPGANANSVAEYVESIFTLLVRDRNISLDKKKIGIVGVGNIGQRVSAKAKDFGMLLLENDPPRAGREANGQFVTLEQIAKECDVITFHTPLVMEGAHPTYHLADAAFFRSLEKKPIIINTSRGEVIDTQALLHAMNKGIVSDAVIDVWENEPNIDLELLSQAYIATPHIAGYSADGKGNATRMVLEGLCKHFGIKPHIKIKLPKPRNSSRILFDQQEDIVLLACNPLKDTKELKQAPKRFEALRNNYPSRREMQVYYDLWDKQVSEKKWKLIR